METSDISIIIADRGFIIVENPQENNLKPRVPTKNSDELYSVTIFHQLHCLVTVAPIQSSSSPDEHLMLKEVTLDLTLLLVRRILRSSYWKVI